MILYTLRENAAVIFIVGSIISLLLFGLIEFLRQNAETNLIIKYNKKETENAVQDKKEQAGNFVQDFTDKLSFYYFAEAIVAILGAMIIFGIPIMLCSTESTIFHRDEYDIDKMITEYKSVECIKENIKENDYLIHCEGFGRDEWIHVVKKSSEYDKFKK